MKDSDIRKILIEYIKTTERVTTRVFQEKSIGSSICDVMTVGDGLTGYEIKSDADNYSRLTSQVSAYNKFFDRNYIVVSASHQASAYDKVPDCWGILCITEDSIAEHRSAKINKQVSRRSQLSILWKLELQNLLAKNNLPMYALKEKGYLADRIAEAVDNVTLGKQIVEELLRRDYSIYDAKDYSIWHRVSDEAANEKSDILSNELKPVFEIIDALSEENLSEMSLDQWISIYRKAKEVQEAKNSFMVEHKPERTPHDVTYLDIEATLGAPYISERIINDFANHICGHLDKPYIKALLVEYMDYTGYWHVNHQRDSYFTHNNSMLTYTYGTSRYNALQILDATLNLREIKVNDTNGKFSEIETVAALAKQKLIIQEFKKWLWEDEDRRWEVEEAYNKMFAGLSVEKFDGSGLKFSEMNADYMLYDYQKDAVQKIISSKNTLLAFDVGAGKTYIMIAASMLMRASGVSRKNVFVVPNNIVGQWAKIFTELYPKAKILVVEPKTFRPEMRHRVLSQIQKEDYDGIIIAYSCFEMIPLSVQKINDDMEKTLSELNNEFRNYRSFTFDAEKRRERERLIKLTSDFLAGMEKETIDDITFEKLGINTLFLDEAHNYKNVPIKTKLKNVNGINTSGSRKCFEMMLKVHTVQEQNDGRGAVFATGTPLCNSIADTYVLQMYLQTQTMKERHLDIFDNWVKLFVMPEQSLEVDVDTSKFRIVRRFARFFNLPELSKLFGQIAVFYAVKEKDKLPQLDDYSKIVIKNNEPLKSYMKSLCERSELIRKHQVDRKYDNMLKVSTDGRKAALSLTLVGEEQKYDEFSKVKRCVNEVLAVYKEYPGCSQLIFCDYSTPKNGQYDIYHDIKQRLIDEGVGEKEIAFVHSAKSERTKLEMFAKVNTGKIRILIGSTFKLGIGANVQTKLKAIHHLDVPWRPADMVQRDGRILRRGNENDNVMIFRYIAEGSFDAYSWQVLETKQRFISQFLAGSAYQRSISDLEDNVLSYAEVKALALSQPLMKTLAETELELKNLKLLKTKSVEAEKRLKEQVETDKRRISYLSRKIRSMEYDVNRFSKMSRAEIMEALDKIKDLILKQSFDNNPSNRLICPGLNIAIYLKTELHNGEISLQLRIYSNISGEDYYAKYVDDDHKNRLAVAGLLKKLDKYKADLESETLIVEARIRDAENELKKTTNYEPQIVECQERYDKLKAMVYSDIRMAKE